MMQHLPLHPFRFLVSSIIERIVLFLQRLPDLFETRVRGSKSKMECLASMHEITNLYEMTSMLESPENEVIEGR